MDYYDEDRMDERYITIFIGDLGETLQVAFDSLGGTACVDIKDGSSYESALANGYNYEGILTIQDLSYLPNAKEESESGKNKGYEVLVWSTSDDPYDVPDIVTCIHSDYMYDGVEAFCLEYAKQLIKMAIEQ